MLFVELLLLALGFVLLVKGADWFVEGTSGIADKFGIPQLVIGLTIVAFGTSAPELATSVISSANESVGIAIGNILGSNICNVMLILGLSAIIATLPIQKDSLKVDLPMVVGASILIILFGETGGEIDRLEGVILAAILIAYTAYLIIGALKNRDQEGSMSELNAHDVGVEEEEESGCMPFIMKQCL